MNQNENDSTQRKVKKGYVDVYCQHCREYIPKELADSLIEGQTIFCEYCGSEIRLTEKGQYYTEKKSTSTKTKDESQEPKNEWENFWERLVAGIKRLFERLSDGFKRMWKDWEKEWQRNQVRTEERRKIRDERRHKIQRMRTYPPHRQAYKTKHSGGASFGYVPSTAQNSEKTAKTKIELTWTNESNMNAEDSADDKSISNLEKPEINRVKTPEDHASEEEKEQQKEIQAQKMDYIEPRDVRSIPGARFDPQTGKPLFKEKLQPKKETKKPLRSIPELSNTSSNQETSNLELKNRIFNILSIEVKQKLENLSLPEEELYSILESFVLLNREIQLKYLEEIEKINDKNKMINPELIKRIQKLPIPREHQKNLIRELEYLIDEKQAEFVEYMESGEDEEEFIAAQLIENGTTSVNEQKTKEKRRLEPI